MNAHLETLANLTVTTENGPSVGSHSNETLDQLFNQIKPIIQQGTDSNTIFFFLAMNQGTNVQCGIRQVEHIGPRSQPEQNVTHQPTLGMRRPISPSPPTQEQRTSKRQRSESTVTQQQPPKKLVELRSLQDYRKRVYSHCPENSQEFCKKLITAGFFHCNVGDRTICIYCNLICQQWKRETDDPSEVHRTHSPNCIYVRGYLTPADETVDQDASSAVIAVPLLPDVSVDRAESGTNSFPSLSPTNE